MLGQLQLAYNSQQALQAQAAEIARKLNCAGKAAEDLLTQYNDLRYSEIRNRDQRAAVEAKCARLQRTRTAIVQLQRQMRRLTTNFQRVAAQIGQMEYALDSLD